MKRTELRRTKPLVATKGFTTKGRSQKKGPGLGQRVAEMLGTAFKHRPKPLGVYRSEQHLKNVAALPCANCRREKYSQAAHPNGLLFGKAKGLKASDGLAFPLCAVDVGVAGCHLLLDQGAAYDKATAITKQIGWIQDTREKLMLLGQWPEAAERDLERFVGSYLRRIEAC